MEALEFSGVTVVAAANIYFDGQVTSRTVKFPDGTTKTLGVMLPGEYDFGTEAAELMEIIAGDIEVRLPSSNTFASVPAGQSFEVPANARFQVKVSSVVDYCCSYLS